MKKAIKMMAYILTMALIITTVMPLSVHAESGAIPTEESYDGSTNEHTIIYYNEDGTETIEDDPIIEYSEYEEDGYRYTTIIYASGSTSTECELISAYPDETYIEDEETEEIEEEYLVSTNSYIEDGCLYTEYYYSTGRCELVVESLDSLTEAPGEEFGDDGFHTITYHLPDGEDYTVDDPIVSEETYIENGVEYTYIEYESGATVTEETYLDEDDYEIITSNPEVEEETFYDEDDDEEYERGAVYGESDGDYAWYYDSKLKKLTIAANNSSILNYTRDGSSFPWYDYKDKIELVAITGIESICANVFKNYPKLKKVYTNGDLEYMSTYAFIGCENLSWIYINSYKCELDPDSWTNLKKMNTTYDDNNTFSDFKVSCHYDTSDSSIYTKCINSGITCETIESSSSDNSFLKGVKEGFYSLTKKLSNLFNSKNKETDTSKEESKNENKTSKTTNIDETPFICQLDNDIEYGITDGVRYWEDTACVVCSIAMLVERRAAYEGYEGDYSRQTGAIELVNDITVNDTNFGHVNKDPNPKYNKGWDYQWPTDRVYDEFTTSDGDHLHLGYTIDKSHNEEVLISELQNHPEGVIAYVVYVTSDGYKYKHAVIVEGYDESTKKYSIINTGATKTSDGRYTIPFENLSMCGVRTDSIDKICYISHVFY